MADLEDITNEAVDWLRGWVQMAEDKTTVTVIAGKRRLRPVKFHVWGLEITPGAEAKYLGV